MKINFYQNLVPKIFNRQVQQNQYGNNATYPNLAPLPCDTVSFSAAARLMGEGMADAPSERMCMTVHNNAEPARFYLEKVLNKYLSPYISKVSGTNAKKYPVFEITTRTKSSTSIREKVASKFSRITRNDVENFSNHTVENLTQSKCPLIKGKTKKDALKVANDKINEYSFSYKTSPYTNPVLFVESVYQALKEKDIIDTSALTPTSEKKYLEKVAEQVVSQSPEGFEHLYDGKYMPTKTAEGVKHYANDIVGARIVLNEAGPEYIDKVFSGLKQAVSDGVLKITKIEVNEPDPRRLPPGKISSDYRYADQNQLNSFRLATNAELKHNKSRSGYLSIHMDIDLSTPLLAAFNKNYDGYTGEIQIIGADVEKLKEVEDLCYKLKDNKNVVRTKYKEFKEYFLTHYKGKKVMSAFDDYTYALYLHQRSISTVGRPSDKFPSIEELGFAGKVPKELDYNILKKIKEASDAKERSEKKIAVLAGKSTKTDPKKDPQFFDVKKFINNYFRMN